ncbi:MAG: prephenate/arogenate dehydrogenase family protein [Parerythrobacter sp.]
MQRVAIIGLGLLGGSLGLALAGREGFATTGYDADPAVRRRAAELELADSVADTLEASVAEADICVLCVPVGAMAAVAQQLAACLPAACIVSDVGSSKQSVIAALAEALPDHARVPAHPVAGTEHSGPEAAFAALFAGRWCILTPEADTPSHAVRTIAAMWEAVGARIETMDAAHHDTVLAVTSHIPHLIAYTIVGTASDLEQVTQGEVIKYSAGGFRDFTRIAASDPTMWRDIFLANRGAVLDVLGRFTEDLTALQRAIRDGDGEMLFDLFSRTGAIRRGIVEQGNTGRSEDLPAS